jgi:methionine aminopeptidase
MSGLLGDKEFSKLLTKYNAAAKIAGDVYNELVEKLHRGESNNVHDLCDFGTRRIDELCNDVFKREQVKGVAFPVSISLNNCVGNYIHEPGLDNYNVIREGDVVKIELGVNIGGCIAVLGETITIGDITKYKVLLDNLAKTIVTTMKHGETNDEIRILIESKCAEAGCFPVENCFSYQHLDGQLKGYESKYIALNHKKYWDDDDNMVVDDNLCFEFEQGEVYTINLTVIPETEEVVYKEPHLPHIYRFNDYYHNLKLKSSREFCSHVKGKCGYNAFEIGKHNGTSKAKLGIKECIEGGILEGFPILYAKNGLPVYHKKFTVIVLEDKSIELKYL